MNMQSLTMIVHTVISELFTEPTTTEEPTLPPLPPLHCDECPGLPSVLYERCQGCSHGHKFNGTECVPHKECPCFYDGIRYFI